MMLHKMEKDGKPLYILFKQLKKKKNNLKIDQKTILEAAKR